MNEDNKLVDILSELLNLYKLVNKPSIAKRLEEELVEPKQRFIYELSNGERTTREIARIAEVSHVTVSNYWKRWARMGLVIPAEYSGRYKSLVDLKEYGLQINELIE